MPVLKNEQPIMSLNIDVFTPSTYQQGYDE